MQAVYMKDLVTLCDGGVCLLQVDFKSKMKYFRKCYHF